MPKGKAKKKKERVSVPVGKIKTHCTKDRQLKIPYFLLDSASPTDDDSESVCSSLDGASVVSEDGGATGITEEETEEDLEFRLAELVDQLTEKKYVSNLKS